MKNHKIRILLLTVMMAATVAFGSVDAQAANKKDTAEQIQDGTVVDQEEPEEPEEPVEPEVPEEVVTPKYVTVRSVALYLEPNTISASMSIPYREMIQVTDSVLSTEFGDLVKVYYQNQTYYMVKDVVEQSLAFSMASPSFKGNNIFQQKFLDIVKNIWENWDTKYAHQSSNGVPDKNGVYGFDCSGLVAYCANEAIQPFVPTYKLSRSIIDLYNTEYLINKGNVGEVKAETVCTGKYDESKLQPGDVLFFNLYTEEDGTQSAKGYNHCGIYIGNGEMIHSSHSFDGKVRIMPVSGIYSTNFVLAKRYIPEKIQTINQRKYTTLTKTKIYTQRSTSSKVALYADIETPVELLFVNNVSWGYVKCGTKRGFVLLKNLCDDIKEKQITCYVRVSSTKLCREFTIKKNYTRIYKGDTVQYVGRVGASNYYEVLYQNQTYYIYSKDGIATKLSTGVVYPD